MIGSSIAHYTVKEKIGSGGMGEVYRASDAKLRRDVALKLLPDLFASDTQRMARFEREAHVLASLNHPNIASIYGLEKEDGRHCLVLELVEGDDLAQRLRAGPIPLEEGLDIARQIAEALEAAHEKGVIHRDLKPANVKIAPDGAVKVLDFGLAKALDDDPAASAASAAAKDLSHSPTLTVAATRVGIVLGTAAYMSPEQAKGRPADRRADIWSFGALLYEILTRRQCFTGETVSDTLASVLKEAPDWSLLPAETPPAVVDLLRRCLEKDPRERLQSIGEARIAIQRALRGQDASAVTGLTDGGRAVAAVSGVGRRGHGMAAWAVSLIAVALLAGLGGRFLGPSAPEPRTRKFTIVPEGLEVDYPLNPALSPDGRHVAFIAGGRLWIRDLDSLDPVEIQESDGAQALFWSPDGASVAYAVAGRLFRVPAAGGKPSPICDLPFSTLDGGAWGPDDALFLAPNSGALYTVSALGGDPKPLFEPVPEEESDFHTPSVLPDGRSIVYTAHRNEGRDTLEVFSAGKRKVILRIEGARLEYAAWSPSGHLVFHRQNTNPGVWAVPFSAETLETTGEPFILAPDAAFPSVARDGSLLYTLGSGSGMRQLVWVDRQGGVTGTVGQPQQVMESPELSPDGRSILVAAREGDSRDIWSHDVDRGTRTRLTFGPQVNWSATWMPAGDLIAFTNGSAGGNRTWVRAADGTSEPELLLEGYSPTIRHGVPWILYTHFGTGTADDLWYVPVEGEGEPRPFLKTNAVENGAQLSPDGRYAVYHSDESGNWEVYLKTFPSGEGKWQVSTAGGIWARWSRSGDEIFYLEGFGQSASMVSVKVSATEPLRLGSPERLFGSREVEDLVLDAVRRPYDVSRDGRHFLMLQEAGDDGREPTRLVLSENWFEAYRKKRE